MSPLINTNKKTNAYTLLSGLKEAVNFGIQRMERTDLQLAQIQQNEQEQKVKKTAYQALIKNDKLQAIAHDLLKRINKLQSALLHNQILTPAEALIKQYNLEVELLNEMHFNVAKTYIGFINKYSQPQVIQLNNTAA